MRVLISGESLPQRAEPGMSLFAGALNLAHPLTGTATSAADDSLMADIARLLDAGEQRRSSFRRIADTAVSWYVPLVHATAALAFSGWYLSGAGAHAAIMIAVSTLIITCPCALALAAPVAQAVASARLFRAGIYLRSGDALERLAQVNHIIFDKTGTLTLGTPAIRRGPEEKTLQAAAMLARASRASLVQSHRRTGRARPGRGRCN